MEINKKTVSLAVVYTLVVFASGRYLAPSKVKIEKETTKVENKDSTTKTSSNKDTKVKKVVKEVTRPDGTKERTIEYTKDTNTTKQKDKDVISTTVDTSKESKTVEYDKNSTSLSALAGTGLFGNNGLPSSIVYGLHAQKRILGPINGGVWGLSNGILGVSLGVTF